MLLRAKRLRAVFDALRNNKGDGINLYEHRVYSQHREDWIIKFLLDTVGFTSRNFVELGFAPIECNCLRLALHENFSGLFIDRDEIKCLQAKALFRDLGNDNIQVAHRVVTNTNLDQVTTEHDLTGSIDVLSIDVDGNDYWFWERTESIFPHIVVIEYNASFGPDRSITVPYDPDFVRYEKHPNGFYHGASLRALERLARRKAYRLVGCDSTGVNAFFLRADLEAHEVRTQTPDQAYFPNRGHTIYKKLSVSQQFRCVEHLPYETVS